MKCHIKIWGLYRRIADRFFKHSNGVFRNILYELDRQHLLQVLSKLDIDWVWIDEHNYAEVLAFRKEDTAKSFERMLRTGEKGVFAMYRGRSIAHCWVYIEESPDYTKVNDIISIRRGEAYIHFCHTDKNYRGNNIYPFLLYALSKHLFENEGVGAIFIDTEIDNIPSQRGIKKIGFREKCLVKRLRLLGKTLIRKSKSI